MTILMFVYYIVSKWNSSNVDSFASPLSFLDLFKPVAVDSENHFFYYLFVGFFCLIAWGFSWSGLCSFGDYALPLSQWRCLGGVCCANSSALCLHRHLPLKWLLLVLARIKCTWEADFLPTIRDLQVHFKVSMRGKRWTIELTHAGLFTVFGRRLASS